jgi:hypothetical protein
VSQNPIHAVLDAAGVPRRSSRAALVERYGIRQHPAYRWDVVEIETLQPIAKGLLWPLSVQIFPQFSPYLPATDFSSVAYVGDDARENLCDLAQQLAPRLGTPQIEDDANTMGRRWAYGAAALSLKAWPPDMQRWPMKNPAHEREPRLKPGCHILIKTGFRKAAAPEELVWLESFVPIAPIAVGRNITETAAYQSPAEQSELEFVREPIAGLADIFGFVGRSADRAALISHHAQLYLVPMADVIGFRVERILPAKGRGGSKLYVECRTNYQSLATKRLTISAAEGVDDSNDLASALSAATGKPFQLGDYDYDA